jgi:CDP-diglyceride synthetase
MGDMLGVVTLLCIVPNLIFVGYTFSALWAWHIVPVFETPEVPLTTAIIIVLIVKWMTWRYDDTPSSWERLISGWLVTGIALLIGWILS